VSADSRSSGPDRRRRVDLPIEAVRASRAADETVFAEAPTVLVETPPVAFSPPTKKPAHPSPVPVEAKAAPVVTVPSVVARTRPESSVGAPAVSKASSMAGVLASVRAR
jgi:hypothetical protein